MQKKITLFIQKYRRTWIFQQLDRYCRFISQSVNCESNLSDFFHDGEYALMKRLAEYDATDLVVFDVGANRGEWSKAWLGLTEISQVYSFEVVEPTRKLLQENLKEFDRAHCLPFGLSDEDFETTVSYIPESDLGSSLNVLPWGKETVELPAQVRRGDAFARSISVPEIFFLKVDTEGHDLKVLKGFHDLISAKKVRCIQFEYGFTYINNRFFLKDAYEYLEEHGYTLGRMYPEGVEFKEYNIFKDEDFRMKNYFATWDPEIQKKVSLPKKG